MPDLTITGYTTMSMTGMIRRQRAIPGMDQLDAAGRIREMIEQLPERTERGSSGSRFRLLLDAYETSQNGPQTTAEDVGISGWFEYTVKPGDTLSEIAQRHRLTSVEEIAVFNRIADPDSIRSGQKIRIPVVQSRGEPDLPRPSVASIPEAGLRASEETEPARGERWIEHIIQPGDTIWSLAVRKYHVNTEDIIRDNKIADPRRIQPGYKLMIRLPEIPPEAEVIASWYGERFHGRPMANGDVYDMYADTVAHRDLPLGTQVELTNPSTGQKVQSVITDRGPYIAGRDVDLSFSLAQKLSLVDQGVGRLVMRVLG